MCGHCLFYSYVFICAQKGEKDMDESLLIKLSQKFKNYLECLKKLMSPFSLTYSSAVIQNSLIILILVPYMGTISSTKFLSIKTSLRSG